MDKYWQDLSLPWHYFAEFHSDPNECQYFYIFVK